MANNSDHDSLAELGQRIRELRQQKGYTSQDHFAYDHEIARTQYHRYEMGANITYLNLQKLADAFGISVSELLEGL